MKPSLSTRRIWKYVLVVTSNAAVGKQIMVHQEFVVCCPLDPTHVVTIFPKA